jgi:antibiotic biosynthesis monooxygenase (ABM) superfamily enzyme
MFGWAGIAAGLGYLVRSEGCQLVLYGSVWLLFNLIRPQGKMRRTKAAGALILLLAGFAIIAIPYMRSKGHVFHRQGIWKLPAMLSMSNNSIGSAFNTNICLADLSISKTMGNKTLITNMCETLMYYFIPGLLTGCYYYFRKQSKTLEQAFFAAAFIIFNVVMLSWQVSCRHFLSRRHTLVLVAFTVFYIPVGLNIIASWLSRRTSKSDLAIEENIQRWFFILLIVGMAICLPKLFKIIGTQKYGYREAAMWLNKNTVSTDIIAVPDMRIVFYAERKGLEYSEQIPEQVDYIVRIVKSEDEKLGIGKDIKEKYSTWVDKRKKSSKLVICKVIH